MRPTRRGSRRGFSLIEILVVVVLIGLMMAIVVPRFRASQWTKSREAADQLARDLEAARSRALATRSIVRIVVDPATGTYTGYLDNDRDGNLAQSAAETAALGVFRSRTLDDEVQFGRGITPDLPGFAGAGGITLPNNRVDFDARGLTLPLGTRGVIYLRSGANRAAVTAVSISASAGIQAWVYRGGGIWE
jgi:prepilin-type N-terminal cleavage/methylation domain-containing protein